MRPLPATARSAALDATAAVAFSATSSAPPTYFSGLRLQTGDPVNFQGRAVETSCNLKGKRLLQRNVPGAHIQISHRNNFV